MEKTRVNKGDMRWVVKIECNTNAETYYKQKGFDLFTEKVYDFDTDIESIVRKLRAVLKGADVIEMPSEEDIKAVAIRHCGPLAQWSGSTVDAFIECAEWLKSKIVK